MLFFLYKHEYPLVGWPHVSPQDMVQPQMPEASPSESAPKVSAAVLFGKFIWFCSTCSLVDRTDISALFKHLLHAWRFESRLHRTRFAVSGVDITASSALEWKLAYFCCAHRCCKQSKWNFSGSGTIRWIHFHSFHCDDLKLVDPNIQI